MPINETDQEQQSEMLEIYCESITADSSAQPPAGLQPGLAETARRLASGLTALQAESTFAEGLRQRLVAQARAPIAPGRWRRWLKPLGALGVAVAAVLLLFLVSQPRNEDREAPGGISRATQGPMVGPGLVLAPGLPPPPDWRQTGEMVASDQGVTLAYLRAMIHEPRFVILFVGVGGPEAAGGLPYLPADLQVLDPTGRECPYQVVWLDSTGGATIGVVTLTEVDPAAASLRLRVTEMRAAQGETLRGVWQIEPIRRFQPGAAINPDQLSELDGLQCFRTAGITIVNHCYTLCDQAAHDDMPVVLAPPANASPAMATPAPLEGVSTTAVPCPAQPTAPLPPTLAPAATAVPPLPVATVTPVMPACGEFTDWKHGLFGAALLVRGPQPHAVYVLITRENGQVRRVSEQEFAEARCRAY